MEPLYEAKFDYTQKNIREISWILFRKTAFGLTAIMGILHFLLWFGRGAAFAFITALAVIGFFFLFVLAVFFLKTSAAFKERGKLGYTNHYKFYEDVLELRFQDGVSIIEYSKSEILKETKDYFLLSYGNSVLPILKKDCPKELLDFLRTNIKASR